MPRPPPEAIYHHAPNSDMHEKPHIFNPFSPTYNSYVNNAERTHFCTVCKDDME